jgi:hypothetical protein
MVLLAHEWRNELETRFFVCIVQHVFTMTLETFHVFFDPVQFFFGLICIPASVSFHGVVLIHAGMSFHCSSLVKVAEHLNW